MVGHLKEGAEIQFISSTSGYGVTSIVVKLVAGEFLLLRHCADTQEDGKRERDKEWTGGEESYSLAEKDGTTTLTVTFDVPPELEQEFRVNYPKHWSELKYWLKERSERFRLILQQHLAKRAFEGKCQAQSVLNAAARLNPVHTWRFATS